jgi:uncharacterized protein (DUF488 family)
MIKLLTIGVYGFTAEAFFQALTYAHADLLCDLRFHRGMRGHRYSFANSARLQHSLTALGIRYLHYKELSPDSTLRELQRQADAQLRVTKRERTTLDQTFIEEYKRRYVSMLNISDFIKRLGPDAQTIALFCVEQEPGACHRSLVAAKLAQDLGLEVENIAPAAHAQK